MSPRLARFQLATYTYFHVCARGNNGQTVFLDAEDYRRYLSLAERYRERYRLRCFAYCLMTNHIHLLWQSPSLRVLSKAMQGLHGAYVIHFNRRHARSGHLFQDRFSSWVIADEHHLLVTKEYIEQNPIKAGFVAAKEHYKWSSATRDGSDVTINLTMK